MEIQLKLSKDFERFLDELKKKYGEDMEIINGIHPSQLDFSLIKKRLPMRQSIQTQMLTTKTSEAL